MSIFGKIMNAIFRRADAAPAQTGGGAASGGAAGTATTGGGAASSLPHTESPASAPTSAGPVDVEAVLTKAAAEKKEKLNWKTSIVDLMKLLGIDSSLENRKELARELGYSGDTNDSATMNVWLHKRVMQELEKNGGKVPASLVA